MLLAPWDGSASTVDCLVGLRVEKHASLQFLACLLLQNTFQVSAPQLASVSSLGQHWLHCAQTSWAKSGEAA